MYSAMESGAPLNDGGRVSSGLTYLYQKTERNLGPKGIESLCVWLLRPWKPISMPDHFIELHCPGAAEELQCTRGKCRK